MSCVDSFVQRRDASAEGYSDNMDFRKRIFSLFIVLLFCQTGCATRPPGSFNFILDADNPRESNWKLESLASSGGLAIKFRLRQTVSQAAWIEFSVEGDDKYNPILLVRISDPSCTGAYNVMVQYKTGSRESRINYFVEKLPWDSDDVLALRWNQTGNAQLLINNFEPLNLSLAQSIGDIHVEAKNGAIEVSDLTYINSRREIQ